jgi:hypothetical protein
LKETHGSPLLLVHFLKVPVDQLSQNLYTPINKSAINNDQGGGAEGAKQ